MTIEEFQEKLKALLREARDSGLDTDQIGEVAEYVISDSWDAA
jgi:hypothetical protein